MITRQRLQASSAAAASWTCIVLAFALMAAMAVSSLSGCAGDADKLAAIADVHKATAAILNTVAAGAGKPAVGD